MRLELLSGIWQWLDVNRETQRQLLVEQRKTREALERLGDLKEFALLMDDRVAPGHLKNHLQERRYERANNGRV